MGHHGGRGTTAAAMVHVNSQLDAKSTYVSYRELLPRGKIVRGQFFRAVAQSTDRTLGRMVSWWCDLRTSAVWSVSAFGLRRACGQSRKGDRPHAKIDVCVRSVEKEIYVGINSK